MNAKGLIFYLLGAISLIIAIILFIKWLDWKFLLPLALGVGSIVLFWMGSSESKKSRSRSYL
jgi:4-amino-4-deoxy-L-arabinose transferase-like glycosyltransferase